MPVSAESPIAEPGLSAGAALGATAGGVAVDGGGAAGGAALVTAVEANPGRGANAATDPTSEMRPTAETSASVATNQPDGGNAGSGAAAGSGSQAPPPAGDQGFPNAAGTGDGPSSSNAAATGGGPSSANADAAGDAGGSPHADATGDGSRSAHGGTGDGPDHPSGSAAGRPHTPVADHSPEATAKARPAEAPATPSQTSAAPGVRPAGPPSLPTVPLPPAGPVHAVAATVQLATSRGFSHARLALNPPELGGVEVLLRSSPAGIVATLTADSPEAARLLEAGAGDLRRQLEGQGIDVERLEVDVSGRQAAGEGAATGAHAGDGGRDTAAGRAAGTRPAGTGHDGTPGDGSDAAALADRIDLGNGFLIDVVA